MAFSHIMAGFNNPPQGGDDDIYQYLQQGTDFIDFSAFGDGSTTGASELGLPVLTVGPTLTPTTRSQTSPSVGGPDDLDLNYGLGPSWLTKGPLDIEGSPPDKTLYFDFMGQNPEILVQGPFSPPSREEEVDDFAIGQSLRSPLSKPDLPPQSTLAPKKRGRNNPLPGQKRVKAASMRKIKACSWCHIHKVECNEATPCDRCKSIFPGFPMACDRARLYEVRFPDQFKATNIWLSDWQCFGYSRTTAVASDQGFGSSSDMALTLPTYVADSSGFSPQPQGYYELSATRTSVPPVTTFGNWPGAFSSPWAPNCLGPTDPKSAAHELPVWAEEQLSIELENLKRMCFSAAIGSLLLAYKNTSLPAPGASPASGRKKKQAIIVNTRALACKAVELRCWFLIWRNPALYCQAQGGQAAAMSKDVAARALVACEKRILEDLDELDTKLTREDSLPVWACFWQMLFVYRELMGMYSGIGHGPSSPAMLGSHMGGPYPFFGDVPAALDTVEHLYRILVIKHAAYAGSSSPVFHKHGHLETGELLAGDERLQGEWENVLLQRQEFYRTFSDKVPSDTFLKTVIIDIEAKIERRRKKNRKQSRDIAYDASAPN